VGLAGLTYMLTGVLLGTNGTIMGIRRRRMEKEYLAQLEAQPVES
jgi:hypothetical protein